MGTKKGFPYCLGQSFGEQTCQITNKGEYALTHALTQCIFDTYHATIFYRIVGVY